MGENSKIEWDASPEFFFLLLSLICSERVPSHPVRCRCYDCGEEWYPSPNDWAADDVKRCPHCADWLKDDSEWCEFPR